MFDSSSPHMLLNNPFSEEVRLLYLYEWQCRECGTNGGGRLELHHIVGRSSNSPFNSCLICTDCHKKMCHTQEEEQRLFTKTFKWLKNIGYKPDNEDLGFVKLTYKRLFTKELEDWLGEQ